MTSALPIRPSRGAPEDDRSSTRAAPTGRRSAGTGSRRARLAVGALGVLLPLVLAGCGGTQAWLPAQRQGTAASPRELALAWSTPASQPTWLPEDATGIRWVAATRGGADRAPAALLARSTGRLPASCEPLPHPSSAAIRATWSAPHPDRVLRCGGWAVAPVPGGYSAWTPVEPDAAG